MCKICICIMNIKVEITISDFEKLPFLVLTQCKICFIYANKL